MTTIMGVSWGLGISGFGVCSTKWLADDIKKTPKPFQVSGLGDASLIRQRLTVHTSSGPATRRAKIKPEVGVPETIHGVKGVFIERSLHGAAPLRSRFGFFLFLDMYLTIG
ncbi:MAG: hypothetical protein JW719_06945 [Pirellulales bacterium]|nr:hypothetical protein [Pirellulales bacterium]